MWFDKIFGCDGDDFIVIVLVSFIELVLGLMLLVFILDGMVGVWVFKGIVDGCILCVCGCGVFKCSGGSGDLFVIVKVVVLFNLVGVV